MDAAPVRWWPGYRQGLSPLKPMAEQADNGPVRSDTTGSLLDRSLSGMLWVAIDKVGGSGVNFLITVILARLLFPEDFGLVAMALIFYELSSVFVESGFSTALIRERSISDADKSTTFIFNLVAAVVLYVLLFIAAPFIATFFDTPALGTILRVLGLNLVIEALTLVQSSALTQRVDFKPQAKARFAAIVVSGALGVGLAWGGHGVWALVVRMVANAAVLSFILWRIDAWRPAWVFDRASFRRLFGFGSRILAAAILDKVFAQAYRLVIGRFYAAATLGFYTQAAGLVTMVINILFRTVQTVSYPVLAKLQGDKPRLKEAYRTILRLCSFVLFPVLVLLGVLAEPVLVALLGEKWGPSVPYLQLLCIAGLTHHLSQVNLNMLLVLGRSDLSLKLEVIKKLNIGVGILIGIRHGVMGLVVAEVVVAWANLLVNLLYSRMMLGYTLHEQFRDVLPTLVPSLLCGACVFLLLPWCGGLGITGLVVMVLAGTGCYAVVHAVSRTREWTLITGTVLPRTITLIAQRGR